MATDSGQEIALSTKESLPVVSWQELVSRLPENPRIRRLGKGISCEAWETKWNGISTAYKDYSRSGAEGTRGFFSTSEAYRGLSDLQGRYLPRLYAVENPHRIIVEELIEELPESIKKIEDFEGFITSRAGDQVSGEGNGTAARWLKGYIEGIVEIHKRDFLVNDFKLSDIVLTKDGTRVVFRDLGNFINLKGIEYRGQRGIAYDLMSFGCSFLALTKFGKENGFGFGQAGIHLKSGYFVTEKLLDQAKQAGTIPSFQKILEILQKGSQVELATAETGKELAAATKDYLWDIGLRIEGEEEYVLRRYAKESGKFKRWEEENEKYYPDPIRFAQEFNRYFKENPCSPEADKVFRKIGWARFLQHYSQYPTSEQKERFTIAHYIQGNEPQLVDLHKKLFPDAGEERRPKDDKLNLGTPRFRIVQATKRGELALERLRYYLLNARNRGDKQEVIRLEGLQAKEQQELAKLQKEPERLINEEIQTVKDFLDKLRKHLPYPEACRQLSDQITQDPAILRILNFPYWLKKYREVNKAFTDQFQTFPWQECRKKGWLFWRRYQIPQSERKRIEDYLDGDGKGYLENDLRHYFPGQNLVESDAGYKLTRERLVNVIFTWRLAEYEKAIPAEADRLEEVAVDIGKTVEDLIGKLER